jgi:hypothetical protein
MELLRPLLLRLLLRLLRTCTGSSPDPSVSRACMM